jgi:hypothetical protein
MHDVSRLNTATRITAAMSHVWLFFQLIKKHSNYTHCTRVQHALSWRNTSEIYHSRLAKTSLPETNV